MNRNVRAASLLAIALFAGLAGIFLMRARKGGGEHSAQAQRARLLARPALLAADPDVDRTQAAASVTGIVRDPGNRPVTGAIVVITRRAPAGVARGPLRPAGQQATGADGRFRMTGLPPGRYGVTATAAGHAPATAEIDELAPGTTAEVQLTLGTGGVSLSGRLLDMGGGVIAGGAVRAVQIDGPAGKGPRLFAVTADDQGTYRLGLARGRYALSAEAAGYAEARQVVYLVRDMVKDMRLMPASGIAGVVIEKNGRQPVAGAEVWLAGNGIEGAGARDVSTDDQGRFLFRDVDAGSYRVTARKGRLVGSGTLVAVGVAQVVEGIEVPLDPGVVVSGRVRGPAGGIEGATIDAFSAEPPFERPVRARSRTDGAYELAGLLPGRYTLFATADRHSTQRMLITVGAKDMTGVDLLLSGETRLRGRVQDAAGAPVARAEVTIRVRGRGAAVFANEQAFTDSDGQFDVGQLPAGSLQLEAAHGDHGIVVLGPEEIAPGETKQVTLTLGTAASIAGTVRFPDGSPASDIQVTARPRSMLTMRTVQDTTGLDGKYLLRPLSVGQVIVRAARKGEVMADIGPGTDNTAVSLGAGEIRSGIDLVVARGGQRLAGTVFDPEGRPVSGATVTAMREHEDFRVVAMTTVAERMITGADGGFLLEDLDDAPHTVWATHPTSADVHLKNVRAGTTGIALRLRRAASIEGIVVGADGKLVGDCSLVLLPVAPPDETAEQREQRERWTSQRRPTERVRDPSGAFAFTRIDAGAYELHASSSDGRVGTLRVALGEGERKRTRVELGSGVKLLGRLIEYQSATPLAALEVRAFAPGGFNRVATSDADGRFFVSGVPPGQRVTVATRTDPRAHVPDDREVDVPVGKDELELGAIRIVRGDIEKATAELDAAGRRGSLGIMAVCRNGQAIINSIEPGLPGAAAGLKYGDRVLAIDGKDVHDLGSRAVAFYLRGPADTDIKLTIHRPGEPAPREVAMRRVSRKR